MAEETTYPAAIRDRWLTQTDAELTAECTLDFFKSTGNGGQKKNKTSSAVRLIHSPTGLSVTDDAERSQHRNRSEALKKLRLAIAFFCRADTVHPPERLDTGLSSADYAIFAARLLDLLAAQSFHVSEAARELGISTSKLTNLLARDPRLYGEVNRRRRSLNLTPLRQNR